MFSRPIYNADPSKAAKALDPAAPGYRMADFGYGKCEVRVFQLEKHAGKHEVREYTVTSRMRLKTYDEYYKSDNSNIVGSDVQETSLYIFAQKHGLRTPEDFALSVTQHFLDTFEMAAESNVRVETVNWGPLGQLETQGSYKGQEHNHVFVRNTNERRYCEVVRRRGEPKPLLISGIADLRLIKTAKASFVGYFKAGELFTEGDVPDRILCADVNARWQYSQVEGIDFAQHWWKVRDVILRAYAGDVREGVSVTSVQHGSYKAASAVLDACPEICSVSVQLPNYPYDPFDFTRFPAFEKKPGLVIVAPTETPKKIGYAQVDRLDVSK